RTRSAYPEGLCVFCHGVFGLRRDVESPSAPSADGPRPSAHTLYGRWALGRRRQLSGHGLRRKGEGSVCAAGASDGGGSCGGHRGLGRGREVQNNSFHLSLNWLRVL